MGSAQSAGKVVLFSGTAPASDREFYRICGAGLLCCAGLLHGRGRALLPGRSGAKPPAQPFCLSWHLRSAGPRLRYGSGGLQAQFGADGLFALERGQNAHFCGPAAGFPVGRRACALSCYGAGGFLCAGGTGGKTARGGAGASALPGVRQTHGAAQWAVWVVFRLLRFSRLPLYAVLGGRHLPGCCAGKDLPFTPFPALAGNAGSLCACAAIFLIST